MRTIAIVIVASIFIGFSSAYSFDTAKLSLTKNITETTLPNGLKVIIKEERSIPLVGFSVTYKVGFRNEETNRTGLTHLLEHMQFKGSTNYKKGEIAKTLSDVGARYNAYTGYDKTVYWEILPAGAFETALAIEADRMENSLYDPEEFKKEKNVVLSEITRYESSPWTKLGRLLNEAVFGSHPYSKIHGTVEDVRKADRDYVYNELYRKYYCPNNAYITVVGNVSPSEALKLITRYFSPIPKNLSLLKERSNPFHFKRGQTVHTEGVASEDFGEIFFALPDWNPDDRDFVSLFFISQTGMLGDFGYDPSLDGGFGMSRFSTDPDYPAETIEKSYIEKNLARFKERWFRQETLDYDSVQSIMMNLIYMERRAGYRDYDRIAKSFDRLTADDIYDAVQKYLGRTNTSTGFFKATRLDARVQPQEPSQGSEGFGKDIDFSDLDNPDAEKIKKTRAIGEKVFRNSLSSVSAYLADIRETRLDNGITLIYKPFRLNQKVAVSTGIRSGSYNQVAAYQAELTWQFVFGGGPQVALRNDLENKGASFGGGSDLNYSSFDMNVPATELDSAMKLLAVSLTNRVFLPLVLEEKKFNYLLGLEEYSKDPAPEPHAELELQKMLFGKRGAGLDPFASRPDVLGLDMTNVIDFYRSFYRPENTVIVVVGDIPYEKVLAMVKISLGGWRQMDGTLKPGSVALEKPASDQTFKTTLPVMQSITLMASPAASYERITNYIALSLANQIFGGGSLTSRLARNIRDKHGLTYGVYTYLQPYDKDSIFNLYMQNSKEDIPQALALFREELKRFKQDGPNEMEILKFKNSMLSSVIFHYENSPSIAQELMYFKMRRNDPKGDELFIRILYSLDRRAILDAIRDGLPEKFFISTAGN
jgi:zinc protease